MKRADDRLIAEICREAYNALSSAWRAHIRWIRLHRVYFKPVRFSRYIDKRSYQAVINDLQRIAEKGIREYGYELPDPKKLRCVIRMFASSSRREAEVLCHVSCGLPLVPCVPNPREDLSTHFRLSYATTDLMSVLKPKFGRAAIRSSIRNPLRLKSAW